MKEKLSLQSKPRTSSVNNLTLLLRLISFLNGIVDFLNRKKLTISQDILALIDPSNNKVLIIFLISID
mgnify:FL=1